MNLSKLFSKHITERQERTEEVLSATGFDALIVSSGVPHTYFSDDQNAPFHSVAHFAHWCPLTGPHHVLRIEPGRKPFLICHVPEDYWYEPVQLGDPFWRAEFELVEAETVDAVWEHVGEPSNAAYVGNEVQRASAAGLAENPDTLTVRLDWERAYKTDYELQCLDEASQLGVTGHKAAKEAFDEGASELEIHYTFLQTLGATERDLPYPSIVALNEKGAFLHYETKRRMRGGKVLLIDAGAQIHGYASDITRTHVRGSCARQFVALRDAMDKLQQGLCDAVGPGIPYGELHQKAHLAIATLLNETDILHAEPEEAVAKGYTRAFFPHGLGHHLGLQVHDVGGHLASPEGTRAPPPKEHPNLRNTRTLEPRHVLTIEPGIYFIEMLLRPFREGEDGKRFNWSLIDELAPLGGIRVEDNVVVTEGSHRNLTRKYWCN
jgi:Xaa-Pro dipeptidase